MHERSLRQKSTNGFIELAVLQDGLWTQVHHQSGGSKQNKAVTLAEPAQAQVIEAQLLVIIIKARTKRLAAVPTRQIFAPKPVTLSTFPETSAISRIHGFYQTCGLDIKQFSRLPP